VTEELEALNRRLAELSSVILERKNIINVLIQNHKRKLQVGWIAYLSVCLREHMLSGTLVVPPSSYALKLITN
jgi:hypothetical protein